MADANTVIIVSDKQELINQISQKLVLLRNLDKIKSCSIDEALSVFVNANPNVIILHCDNNNIRSINLIKQIRADETYKNLPILLLNENCSREVIIEAFDSGINDVLFMPIVDYELLIRVIWCLQKNELNLNIESRVNFLKTLGVVENESEIYSAKYCDDFLKNEIAQSRKYRQKACILLVAPDKKYPNQKSAKEFIDVIKSAIRINDSIITCAEDKYYIYLQKTKLNGAYSVFERINNTLGIDAGANAGVVEVHNQKFEDIVDALGAALEKANENTNSLIVASDFYAPEEGSTLIINNEDYGEEQAAAAPQSAFDKNSIKLFNQAFNRKVKVVIEPVFKKYETLLNHKKPDYEVTTHTGAKSVFSVNFGETSAALALEYDGLEHVLIRLVLIQDGQRKLFETQTVDFTILNYKQISSILSELLSKFSALVG